MKVVDHYALFYETVAGYVEKREPFRQEHLDKVFAQLENKDLVMGGAFDDPADQALLVFTTKTAAISFAKNDPYVKNGVVAKWYVRKWRVVMPD